MKYYCKVIFSIIVLLLEINVSADNQPPSSSPAVDFAKYPTGTPPRDAPPSYEEHTPYPVHDFLDSVGINTHIDAKTTSYNDVDLVATCLKYIGIHYVREDAFEGGTPFQVDRYLKLVQAGARIDFNMGGGDAVDLVPVMLKAASELEQAAPGSVSSLEGYNEVDGGRKSPHHLSYNGKTVNMEAGDYEAAVETQRHLYDMTRNDPVLENIPVLPFSIAWFNRSDRVGDVSAYVDYANVHAYAVDGGSPAGPLATQVAGTKHVKGKPIIMTETGYPTLYPGAPLLKNLVDEQVQERFLLDTLFDNFTDKVVRTYLYELLDRRANYNDSTDQAHYGVFRYDGTPKPAATAIRNLLTILGNQTDPTPGSKTTPLSYELTSTVDPKDTDFQMLDPIAQVYRTRDNIMKENFSVLLQKKPGVYDLVIWSEPAIWVPRLAVMVPRPEIDEATLNLPSSHGTVDVYDPTLGTIPIRQYTHADHIKALIVDHPIIVEISP